MIPAHVITVSDRCHAGTAEDLSGPLAARLLAEHGVEASVTVIPDEVEAIRAAITSAAASGARLVFTTGGTGLSPRDVTPEATEPLLATRIDGLAEAIRRRGEENVASAALSRGLVGVTARSDAGTLVVNAPRLPRWRHRRRCRYRAARRPHHRSARRRRPPARMSAPLPRTSLRAGNSRVREPAPARDRNRTPLVRGDRLASANARVAHASSVRTQRSVLRAHPVAAAAT